MAKEYETTIKVVGNFFQRRLMLGELPHRFYDMEVTEDLHQTEIKCWVRGDWPHDEIHFLSSVFPDLNFKVSSWDSIDEGYTFEAAKSKLINVKHFLYDGTEMKEVIEPDPAPEQKPSSDQPPVELPF